MDWRGGTVWRHADQLVCYESEKKGGLKRGKAFICRGSWKGREQHEAREQKLQVPVLHECRQ